MFYLRNDLRRPWHLSYCSILCLQAEMEAAVDIEALIAAQLVFLPEQAGGLISKEPLVCLCGGVLTAVNWRPHGAAAAAKDTDGEVAAAVRCLSGRRDAEVLCFWLGPSAPPDLAASLRRQRFEERSETFMLLRLHAADAEIAAGTSDDLRLHFVSGPMASQGFAEVMGSELGSAAVDFYKDVEWKESWPIRILVASSAGQPVAAGSLFWHEERALCGVFDVVVLAGHRRRGIGSAILQRLLQLGHEAFGAERFCLSASGEDGLRLYERAGFRAVGRLDIFELPLNGDT
eukprot:TRINITY_DN102400_c0_g1_i1.p1 TRINITY_DN102400_c0_g1~~TRINITY_DN102400_c0_g1_i1.p1  ORF type:complete len:289 (-),score=51.93 TRINITY_DN102400_c0_g1_i1:13-879(-)